MGRNCIAVRPGDKQVVDPWELLRVVVEGLPGCGAGAGGGVDRRRALVEQGIAEFKGAGPKHVPSSHFMDTAAWLATDRTWPVKALPRPQRRPDRGAACERHRHGVGPPVHVGGGGGWRTTAPGRGAGRPPFGASERLSLADVAGDSWSWPAGATSRSTSTVRNGSSADVMPRTSPSGSMAQPSPPQLLPKPDGSRWFDDALCAYTALPPVGRLGPPCQGGSVPVTRRARSTGS